MGEDITAKPYDTIWYRRGYSFPIFNGREIKIPRNLPVKKKMQIYDILFRKMQNLIDKYNPCEKRIENGLMRCIKYEDISECCHNKKCKYLTPSGCGVENLMCKLHICYFNQQFFRNKYPILWKRWTLWHIIMIELDLNRGWASKKEVRKALIEKPLFKSGYSV